MNRSMMSSLIIVFLLVIVGAFYFRNIKIAHEAKKLILKYSFGKKGQGEGEFYHPKVLVIKGDYLYVSDTENHRIQIFEIKPNAKPTLKFTFGKEGKALGEFNCPSGLAIKDNYLFVADGGNSRIQIINVNADGSLIVKSAFGERGTGLGKFEASGDYNLAINDTNLFVTDGVNNRIQIFNINSDGSIMPKFSFGKEGKNLGEFGRFAEFFLPEYINLAIKDNYLYAADSNNYRIQIFNINSDGSITPKSSFGKGEKGFGDFGLPYGMAIKDNYLFIADAGLHRIQVLEIKK